MTQCEVEVVACLFVAACWPWPAGPARSQPRQSGSESTRRAVPRTGDGAGVRLIEAAMDGGVVVMAAFDGAPVYYSLG